MNIAQTAEFRRSLEHFRHLLFHYQMESGSVQNIFQFFEQDKSMGRFEALRELDPNLMSQLLAREYVIQARKAKSPDKAREHLETALNLDPNCPEACFEYASLSDTPETAMMWYQRSVDAAESLIGRERIEELMAQFPDKPWQQVETLTYLKAKVCLAEKLFRHGYYEAAALRFRELLDLYPADELNLRHYLMVCLLAENQLQEAEKLLAAYRGDCSAAWYYCRSFLFFKREGGSRKAKRSLLRAFSRNLWVSVFLLGIEKMPKRTVERKNETVNSGNKTTLKEGSRKEALDAVQCIAPAFCEDAQLVVWVWETLKSMPLDEDPVI